MIFCFWLARRSTALAFARRKRFTGCATAFSPGVSATRRVRAASWFCLSPATLLDVCGTFACRGNTNAYRRADCTAPHTTTVQRRDGRGRVRAISAWARRARRRRWLVPTTTFWRATLPPLHRRLPVDIAAAKRPTFPLLVILSCIPACLLPTGLLLSYSFSFSFFYSNLARLTTGGGIPCLLPFLCAFLHT